MELAFILVYAAILGLVAPYLGIDVKKIGSLVPGAIALTKGALAWAVLTWCGMHYDQAWIWVIVMLAMPAAMVIGTRWLSNQRA
ncbi:MAG: hypothetical protein RL036_884 [Actinomycetota bacterium]|jgi:hypothetical protein